MLLVRVLWEEMGRAGVALTLCMPPVTRELGLEELSASVMT